MYPAQTSFIPVQIALTRFLEIQGIAALFKNYPYWYLGTTPFRYLTGPIVPFLLSGLHLVFSGLSLFNLFLFLIFLSFLLGGLFLFLLVLKLGASKKTALLSAIFYLFGPMMPFLFPFSDGVHLMALSFLPLSLLFYFEFLKTEKFKNGLLFGFLVAFLLLIDSTVFASLFLGMLCIFIAQGNWQRIEKKIGQSFLFLLIGLCLATLWYTPKFWLTIFWGPSFGGRPLGSVILWLGKLLPLLLALVFAVFSNKVFRKKNPFSHFWFSWLVIFGSLTLFRFLSDPDFWLDWSLYGVEIQMGIGMMLGEKIASLKKFFQGGFLGFYLILYMVFFQRFVLGTLQKEIGKSVEYKIGQGLSKVVKGEKRVFLSGTTAFWLNAFFDISQVRGGNDRVSKNQDWAKAAWEIREGEDIEKTLFWLKKLEISFLVVHGKTSQEFFHDFKNLEKFGKTLDLEKIYEDAGDIIYKVKN